MLGVVGFHAEISTFAAGFAGVDVFFVISGFLITGIILEALAKGTFSFREFYARRANRILPALLLVLFATIVLGWYVLFGAEFKSLSQHVTASSFFVSNFLLWSEAGYFDSQMKPLLHLWSLAVEEQFYLVWPVIMVLFWKRKVRLAVALSVAVGVSFCLSIAALQSGYGTAAFYFPIFRFWEIGAGGLLAIHLGASTDRRTASGLDEIIAVAGILSLAVTAFVVDNNTLWPGLWAILPVAGTAALIWSGPSTKVGKLFSARFLVAVGLVSYPLYLWHWPLMALARLVNEGQLSRSGRVGLIVLSGALAFATYRYIELPIRFGARKRRSAVLLGCGLAAIGLTGFVLARSARPRLDSVLASRSDAAKSDWTYPGGGFEGRGSSPRINAIDGDTSRVVVVIGDSHVEQYWPRFVALHQMDPRGPKVIFVTHEGCPTLPGTNRTDLSATGSRYKCHVFFEQALRVASLRAVKTVVFGGYWENYLEHGDASLVGGGVLNRQGAATDSAFRMLAAAVRELRANGKRVVLLLSIPVAPWYQPDAILLPRRMPGLEPRHVVHAFERKIVEARDLFVNRQLHRIAAATGAEIIDPVDFLCDSISCAVTDSAGEPIYRDDNHMRASFARKLTFLDTLVRK